MKKLIILSALVCLNAHAGFRTGNSLFSEMSSESYQERSLALGYIMGVTDAGGGDNHCPPSNVTAGQVQDMVRNFIVGQPAIRHMDAAAIIFYVLGKAWPCKKGQSL